jgi:hypothetical protein
MPKVRSLTTSTGNPLIIEDIFSLIGCALCGNKLDNELHFRTCEMSWSEEDKENVVSGEGITSTAHLTKIQSIALSKLDCSKKIRYFPDKGFNSLRINDKMRDLCKICECYINPEDHLTRCSGTINFSVHGGKVNKKWSELKSLAWIGDTLHSLDIKLAANAIKILDKEKGAWHDLRTNAEAQAGYLTIHKTDDDDLIKLSTRQKSTVFEAMYYGEFRKEYLISLFGGVIAEAILRLSQKALLEGFDSSDDIRNIKLKFPLSDVAV